MAPQSNATPLVAIVGETASGKTSLAIDLAQMFDGEIIAADSRTVYKGMDIGTAKPMPSEQALVPHHLLDVVEPDEPFTAADFKRLAMQAIGDITARGHIPFLVGGTGLYVNAVLYDFGFREAPEPELRKRLSALSVEALQALAKEQGIALPQNYRNPRHLTRAIEAGGQAPTHQELRPNTTIIGIKIERDSLEQSITKRIDHMIANGFAEEVRRLGSRYGWDVPVLKAPGYSAFREYILGAIDAGEARRRAIHETMQLAKRQRTWFKRNKSIHWISKKEQAVDLLTTKLSK